MKLALALAGPRFVIPRPHWAEKKKKKKNRPRRQPNPPADNSPSVLRADTMGKIFSAQLMDGVCPTTPRDPGLGGDAPNRASSWLRFQVTESITVSQI